MASEYADFWNGGATAAPTKKNKKNKKDADAIAAFWGGTPSGGAGGGASTQRAAVQKAVAKAGASGDQSFFQEAKDIAGRTGARLGASPIGRILETMDLARAGVVSGVKELDDLTEGRGFSADDWLAQTKGHIGVGDLINEADPDMNIWAKRGLGFLGDVILDPLTYTGVGAVAKAGGALTKGARVTSRQAAKIAVEAGEKELADRIARRGVGTLTKAEGDKLGIRTGVQFGAGSAKVHVPGSSAVSRSLTDNVIAPIRSKARQSEKLTKVGDAFDAIPGLGKLRRSDPVAAVQVQDANREARGVAEGLRQELEDVLGGLHKTHKDVDRATLARAVDFEDPEARAITGKAWEDMAWFFSSTADRVQEITGKKVFRREDYLPRRMTREFRELLADEGKAVRPSGKARKVSFENGREYRRGKKWLGVTLVDGSMKEMEDIAKAKFGDDYVKIFNDDPWQLAQGYINEVVRSVTDARFIKNLEDAGLAEKFDLKAYKKDVKRGTSQALKADKFRGKYEAADDRAAAAAEGADALAAQPNPQLAGMASGLERAASGRRAATEALDGDVLPALEDGLDEVAMEGAALRAVDVPSDEALIDAQDRLRVLRADRKDIQNATKAAPIETPPATAAVAAAPAPTVLADGRAVDEVVAEIQAAQDALDSGMLSKTERLETSRQIKRDEAALEAAAKTSAAPPELPRVEPPKAGLSKEAQRLRSAQYQRVRRAINVVNKERDDFDQAMTAYKDHVAARADIDKRTATLERELAKATGRRAKNIEAERDLLDRAAALYDAADVEGSPTLQRVARLEATAAREEAKALRFGEKHLKAEGISRRLLSDTAAHTEMVGMIEDGLKKHLDGQPELWTSPELVDLVKRVREMNTPQNINKVLRTHDAILGRWKAYALLSPGFHGRNWMGGMFNNSLAGVTPVDHYKFLRALYQIRGGRSLDVIKDPQIREAFVQMDRLGAFGSNNIRDLADVSIGNTQARGLVDVAARKMGKDAGKLGHLDPTNLDNPLLHLNRKAGNEVEKLLRGPLFLKAIREGKSPVDALHEVATYHFDYDELAQWEKTWGKRVLPFYTWTRKNFPLQVEHMIRKPGRFTAYAHAKRNIEQGTEEDDMVPEYYAELLAIKSPWKTGGEDPIYMTPDLPFRDLGKTFSVSSTLSSTNPIFKTPIELATNTSLFTGQKIEQDYQAAEPLPQVYWPLVPLLVGANGMFGMPKIHRGQDGEWLMGRKDAYKIEQALPTLGKLRRVLPNEERYEGRALTSRLSNFAGVGSTTLNESAKYGAGAERLETLNRMLRERGIE